MLTYLPSFSDLNKARKNKPAGNLIKLALLGDTPTQLLAQAIEGACCLSNLHVDLWEADFNQIDIQVNNPYSTLYDFQADYVLLFFATETLKTKFYKTVLQARADFASTAFQRLKNTIETILHHSSAKVLLYNFYEIDDAVYGNYAGKTNKAFITHLRKLNVLLQEWTSTQERVSLVDVATEYHRLGRSFCFAPNIYIQSGFVWSIDFIPYVAKRTVDIIAAEKGFLKKCLILDLDDTLWGGTVGDDGWQNLQIGELGIGKAFTELQYWIKELQMRGIIICVCSKNDEDKAREVFEKHPDMVLKPEDIAVFVANWENKADNIRTIKEILNIGYDSMVFIDNSPFERNLVRKELPEVTVPELPEDPAAYLVYLQSLNLFETATSTEQDVERTKQYREEASRVASIKHFTNEEDYLKSLLMKVQVSGFDDYNIPRVAQLTQRSNQFNLRTIRYNEADIRRMSIDDNYVCLAFHLSDKFGDYGLISVVILHKTNTHTLFIDTWLMSCRVLKRGVEQFVMNKIVETAAALQVKTITAEYIPSGKNEMVKDLLSNMQFAKKDHQYELSISNYLPLKHFISQIDQTPSSIE